ncbi:hypothetical protein BJX96DRAFT_149396 [Aspergillus floccosus]
MYMLHSVRSTFTFLASSVALESLLRTGHFYPPPLHHNTRPFTVNLSDGGTCSSIKCQKMLSSPLIVHSTYVTTEDSTPGYQHPSEPFDPLGWGLMKTFPGNPGLISYFQVPSEGR